MALMFSKEQINAARFEASRPKLMAAMMRHDRDRFRSLGPYHFEEFVRSGWSSAQALGLRYVNDIAYLLFLMTFLGSQFLNDFRYAPIAGYLKDESRDWDRRIRDARAAFLEMGHDYIGENGEVYLTDMRSFLSWMEETEPTVDAFLDALGDIHSRAPAPLTDEAKERVRMDGAETASALGLETRRGLFVSTALRYWLGVNVETDHLYPWIRDIAVREGTPEAKTAALEAYALKRLSKQLRGDKHV